MTLVQIGALAVLGGFTGFAAGLLGIGGGMIMVPFLTFLFTIYGFPLEVVVHIAIATSMATIIFTSLSSVRAHHKRGAVRWDIVILLVPGILIGALLGGGKLFALLKTSWLSLIFALFDAEEMGLQGAKAFVANPPVALDKIKLNINMDMISHNDKGELYAVGTFKYPQLKKYLITTNPNVKLMLGHDDPKLGHDDWTNQSDQGAFNAKNIPFIYFGVEDHPDYHKATDEFKNINKEFYVNAVSVIQEVILNIDKKRDIQAIFKENLQMKKQ